MQALYAAGEALARLARGLSEAEAKGLASGRHQPPGGATPPYREAYASRSPPSPPRGT